MITLKVLSAAAVVALALPAVTPTESFAQVKPLNAPGGRPAGAPPAAAAAPRFNAPPRIAGAPQFAHAPQFNGPPRGAGAPQFTHAPQVAGAPAPMRGGGQFAFGGGHHHHHGGGFIPGAVAGAVIGGAIASSQGPYYGDSYYGGSPYYAGSTYYAGTPYYDNEDDTPVVQATPDTGGDDVAYCMQTYRSYDPRSGTYLGYDGLRHPCP